MAGGKRWVEDMDLEKFFDRVNHDIVMSHRTTAKRGRVICARVIRLCYNRMRLRGLLLNTFVLAVPSALNTVQNNVNHLADAVYRVHVDLRFH